MYQPRMLVGNGKMSEIVDTIVQVLKVNYVMPGVVGGGCGPLVSHSITRNTMICSGMPRLCLPSQIV